MRAAISPAEVTAVVVTRGDIDMGPVTDSLQGFAETIVYDNAARPDDLSCYGRFVAGLEAKTEYLYMQDDDIIVPWRDLLALYQGYDEILASRPVEEPWRFLGVGAIFPAWFLRSGVLERYMAVYGADRDFYRVSDVVFAYQRPYRACWVGYEELPWSRAPNRMYHQIDHIAVRERAVARIEKQGWLIPEISSPSGS